MNVSMACFELVSLPVLKGNMLLLCSTAFKRGGSRSRVSMVKQPTQGQEPELPRALHAAEELVSCSVKTLAQSHTQGKELGCSVGAPF